MKKILLSISIALVTSFAWGQRLPLGQPLMETEHSNQGSQQTKANPPTTTQASGTIRQFTPGSAIVLRESNGPVRYRLTPNVTYVTRSGRVLSQAAVKERVRAGVPAQVQYTGEGSDRVVDRVIIEND